MPDCWLQMPDCWLLDAGLLAFRCRTTGFQMPDYWLLDAGLLAFRCRTAGFQMPDYWLKAPDYWLLDVRLLAFRCRTAGFQMPDCWLEVSIRKVLLSVTSTQVFLGFPVLKANAQLVPKIPNCHYMLRMQPSRLKFISNQFHILCACKITTATG